MVFIIFSFPDLFLGIGIPLKSITKYFIIGISKFDCNVKKYGILGKIESVIIAQSIIFM